METKKAEGSSSYPSNQWTPDYVHAWLQWKGTDVCMDIHCACGAHGHIDGDFTYYLVCKHCGRKYFVNGHIELLEVETCPNNMPAAKEFEDSDLSRGLEK